MGTNEIKQMLHEGIENIDDHEFLLTIKELIDQRYPAGMTLKLSSWQKDRIMESERQTILQAREQQKEMDWVRTKLIRAEANLKAKGYIKKSANTILTDIKKRAKCNGEL